MNKSSIQTDKDDGALAAFLNEAKADVLICVVLAGGAQNALAQAGIKLLGGVMGNADEAC